ncbi:hypothetical protein ACFO7V_11750 [Glutamicibacter bergerei]|uniref:Uncharacterized protein n=1 Tax=Glutamicibacter bergerei TaxID=256702 RepID=A0ABV9MNJ5_9MICC|nr:hypothetical protein [Micrococcaceae bacterium]
MGERNRVSSTGESAVVVCLFLAVAVINLPRVPQLNEFTVAGWVIAGVLLIASLVLAIGNYRSYSRT